MSFSDPIYSILCLGPDQAALDELKSAFGRDYKVYTAASGRNGLLEMNKHTLQVVIADQELPDMSGLDFLNRVREVFPECMLVLMTNEKGKESAARAFRRGYIYRYIRKPWDLEELKLSIDSAMEFYNLKIQNRDLIQYLEDAKRNLEQKVMERTREIERQRINITDSLHYASRIQRALMVPSEELNRIMPPHFILNKPKDIVSGDFFWVSRTSERLITTVADCTGHGVPGAFMSVLGISLLNEIVSESEPLQAHEILNELREQVIRALGQKGRRDETREGMELALCIVDFNRRIIQFSGAFRPLYLVRKGELHVIKGDRMPIGIYGEQLESFTSSEVPFLEKDLLYMFTDGYVDQIGGLERKTFKTVRFKNLLKEIWDKPFRDQKAILREEIEIWRGGQEQIDDMMVLGMELSET